jgi:hypothetical protein
MPSIILAYSNSNTIPSAGSQRITITVPVADDTGVSRVFDEIILADKSIDHDVIGVRLILKVFFDPTTFTTHSSFLRSFFNAAYTWAVYGEFEDTTNSANDNLCACISQEKDVELTEDYATRKGYKLISSKVF